ncbi:MAG: trypsin-like peptidase domain-containing protein [Clostridiales bacterium]|nr:trypsin-like peptidase domain-containing protein [Clostridiales bacterium]
MENENNEQLTELTEQKNKAPERSEKEKNLRFTLLILSLVLVAGAIFSGFQSFYIFKLNNGEEGIFSYTAPKTNTDPTSAIESMINSDDPASDELPEPWFALEDAASVTDPNKTRMSVVDIVKEVSPATVPISVISVDDGKETKIGSGTGFIITSDGYIVTNQHVVVLADKAVSTYYVVVVLPGADTPVRAEIVGSDEQTDIAVLKVDTDKELPCVTLGDSDTLQSGELAITIGNSMGNFDDSVTVGVISAPKRQITRNGYLVDVIQTDAAINPGNSGGPLINSFAEVVGITNSKIVNSTTENLSFAIPINSVKTIIESLINYGKVINRPYLGISVKYVADESYYGAKGGVYIAEVVEGGPAAKAGIEEGDRIISMGGVEIVATGDIIKVRDAYEVGDAIEIVVERDGRQITLTLVIGDSADF